MIELGGLSVKLSADLKGLVSGLAKAKAQLIQWNHNVKRTLDETEQKFTSVGKSMMLMGGAIKTANLIMVKEFANFEEELANVSTVLDEQSMRLLPQYGEQIKNLAIEMGEGTDTLARGLNDILQAMIAPEKAMGVLEASAKAAKAGMTDTGTATKAILTILNSYAMSADRASEITDKLFTVRQRGVIEFSELSKSIGLSASLASMAGVSFEDLGTAITLLTRAGLDASETMTSINGIIRAFLTPSEEAKDMAKLLRFELSTATLSAEGLLGVFSKLKNLSPEEMAIIAPEIRGLRGFASAIKNLELGFEDYNAIVNSTGETQKAFDKVIAITNNEFKRTWQSVRVLGGEIGAMLAPTLVDAFKKVRDIVAGLREWISNNQELTSALVLGTAALGTFMLTAGAGSFTIGIMIKSVSTLIGVVSSLGSVMISSFQGIIALALNPVVLAVVALGAAFYAVRAAINQNLWGMAEVWKQFKEAIRKGVEVMGEWFSDLFGWIPKVFGKMIVWLTEKLKEFLERIGKEFSRISAFIMTLWDTKSFKTAMEAGSEAFESYTIESMQQFIDSTKNYTVEKIGALKDSVVEMYREGWIATGELGAAMKKQFEDDMKGVMAVLDKYSTLLLPKLPDIPDNAKPSGTATTGTPKAPVNQTSNATKKYSDYDVQKNISRVMQSEDTTRLEKIKQLESYLEQVKQSGAGAASSIRGIQEAIEDLELQKTNPMTAYITGLRQDFQDLSTYIGQVMSEAASSIEGSMSSAFQSMITGAKSFKDAIKGFLTDILNAFAKMISDMAAHAAMAAIFSGFTGGADGGSGGLLSSLFGIVQGKAKGGIVRPVYAAAGYYAKGTDTVPAMLTPGEMVIPKQFTEFMQSQGIPSQQQPININIINPWDGQSVMKSLQDGAIKAVLRNHGRNGPIRTMIRETQA